MIPLAENKHEDSYRQNKADVFITMEPIKSQLAALGAHVIFDSSQIPNEIIDVLLVHEEVFQQRREEVCRFVRQWFRIQDYLKTHPDEAHAHMGKRLGKTADEFRSMLNGLVFPSLEDNLEMLAGSSPKILELSQRLNEVMVREKQLAHPVDIVPSLVPDIESCIR